MPLTRGEERISTSKGKQPEGSSVAGGDTAGSSAGGGKDKKASGTLSEDGNNSRSNAPGRSRDGTKRTPIMEKIRSKVTGKK